MDVHFRLGTQIEVRSGWRNQDLPIFVRMMDKDSNWSRAKGLKTLIPTALTFSLLGYPYILPDMIGGKKEFWSAKLNMLKKNCMCHLHAGLSKSCMHQYNESMEAAKGL